jgi:hypothetical protein
MGERGQSPSHPKGGNAKDAVKPDDLLSKTRDLEELRLHRPNMWARTDNEEDGLHSKLGTRREDPIPDERGCVASGSPSVDLHERRFHVCLQLSVGQTDCFARNTEEVRPGREFLRELAADCTKPTA